MGFELSPDPKGKTAVSGTRGNESGNNGPVLDSDLAALIAAWPTLSADDRALIAAVLSAAARRGR